MANYNCNICNKYFNCYSKLELHEFMHNGVRPFKCDECGKEFRRKSHIKDHLYLHSKVKDYKCDHCDKSFASSSILKRHAKRHSFQRIFKCQHCSKSFFELAKLRRHFDSHTGYRPHQCGYCQRAFIHQADLKRHLLSHTQETQTQYSCPDPSDASNAPSKRKPKNLRCEFCGKMLSTVVSLKEHVNIHLGTKPFKCQLCDKTFNKHIELQRHNLRHSGHRPFACLDCERCFFSPSELSRHVANQHADISVLRCEHCTASFCELSHLNEHMQSHFVLDASFQQTNNLLPIKVEESPYPEDDFNETRQFACTFCPKIFDFKSIQLSHMRKHSMKRPIKCAICFIKFSHMSHLFVHKLSHKLYNKSLRKRSKRMSVILEHSKLTGISDSSAITYIKKADLFGIINNQTQETSQLKIKVDSSKFKKSPQEMWESVFGKSFEGEREMEIVSCEVELTFCLHNKAATNSKPIDNLIVTKAPENKQRLTTVRLPPNNHSKKQIYLYNFSDTKRQPIASCQSIISL